MMNIANGTVQKIKRYFKKTIRKNKGGGADWKDNMKIIPPTDTYRRLVDGVWLPAETGVCMPSGTSLTEAWVKTHDFDGNPYPDNEARLEVVISPWQTYQGKDGKTYGDELSIANLTYNGEHKGRYFDEASQQFQLITPEIAHSMNMLMNEQVNRYEYNSQGVKAVSVDSENVDAPLESSGVETVRTQQPFEKDESFLSKSAPATITTDFDDDIPF
tara:strand:- start:409 stop:1056 length:648 start_codon:yes stop_codon:yes gene_type:complete